MNSNPPHGEQEFETILQERIDILFHEIELAVKWDRPSILFAIYKSNDVRDQVNALLAEQLASLDQKTHRIKTDQFDFISGISQLPDLEKTVLLIEGFKWECGREGLSVLKEFNKHWDYFIDNQIRAIFWLYEQEVSDFSEGAAECWLLRQRVIDFVDLSQPPANTTQSLEPGLPEAEESLPDVELSDESLEQILNLVKEDKADASHVNKLLSQGILGWRKGKPASSLKYLQAAAGIARLLGNQSLQAQCQNAIALAASERGDIDDAILAFQSAASLSPDSSPLWNNLGQMLSQKERNEEAINAFKKSLACSPQDFKAWDGLGNVYLKMGLHQNAISAFEKALEYSPNFESSMTGIGQAYLETGQWEKAVAPLGRAVKQNPHAIPAWISLGKCYSELERVGDAIAVYQKAIEFNPEKAILWKELGSLYLAGQDFVESISAFQKAASLCPQCPQAKSDLAYAHYKIGDYDTAAEIYEETIPLYEDRAVVSTLQNLLGDTYMHLKEYEKAIAAYEKADKAKLEIREIITEPTGPLPEIEKQNIEIVSEYEINDPVLERGEEMNEANQVFDLKSAPEWNELGNAHLKTGAYNDAIAAYTKAIELSTNSSWPYIKNLAHVHYHKGKMQGRLSAGKPEASDVPDDDQYDPLLAELFDTDSVPNPERGDCPDHSSPPVHTETVLEGEGSANTPAVITCPQAGTEDNCPVEQVEAVPSEAVAPVVDLPQEIKVETLPAPASQVSQPAFLSEPRNSIDWNERGNFLARRKAYDDSIKAYKKAIELNPRYGLPYSNLGLIYYHLGKFDTASLLLKKSIELLETPEDRASAWNKLGDSYRRLGDYESALHAYQKSSELSINLKPATTRARATFMESAVVG